MSYEMSYFTEYKKRSGLTLVEIMIASSVLLLLVGLFFSVLVPTFRCSARDSIKVEMRQSAMHALNRIEKDLKQTVVGGLSLSPATSSDSLSGLSLVRFIDVGASGAVTWEERAHIYF